MSPRRSLSLETPRLVHEPFDDFDGRSLLELFRHPDVRRYLLDGREVDDAWMRDEIVASAARFARGDAGLWSLRLRRGSDEIIGCVGFREFFDPPRPQLLYALLPTFWGRGLATEAAGAALDFVFGELGWAVVEAATDVPNTRSAAVLERLGFVPKRVTEDGAAGTAFYSLRR